MFLRRISAFAVDVYVVYSIAYIVLFALNNLNLVIAFEFIFVAIGVIYSISTMLFWNKSIGYILFNLGLSKKDLKPLQFFDVLKAAFLNKWFSNVIMPNLLIFYLFNSIWIDSLFPLYITLSVLIINVVFLFLTKRMWYDNISGFIVKTEISSKKLKWINIVFILISVPVVISTMYFQKKRYGFIPCRFEIYQTLYFDSRYDEELKKIRISPIEYINNKFKRHDIVVLCERTHPESTQWDFIMQMLENKNFNESVDLIFTEYGHRGLQQDLDSLLNSKDSLEINKLALNIVRNDAVWPYSDLTNFYNFLLKVAFINRVSNAENKYDYKFIDQNVRWNGMTKASYQNYINALKTKRDSIMAYHIISHLDSIEKGTKCIVVLNHVHAMNLTQIKSKLTFQKSTYTFLKERYQNRITNILINNRMAGGFPPIANGTWNQAFKKNQNRAIGFDFAASRFGSDHFDMLDFLRINTAPFNRKFYINEFDNLKYSDVFDGMVYINSEQDFIWAEGIPGYFDSFTEEALNRSVLLDETDFIKRQIACSKHFPEYRSDPAFKIETLIEISIFLIFTFGMLVAISIAIYLHINDY